MSEIILNSQQKEGYDGFCDWYYGYESGKSKPYYVICGPAGTGKSVLISYIVSNLEKYRKEETTLLIKTENDHAPDSAERAAYLKRLAQLRRKPAVIAFTNKAVKVLKKKGLSEAKTTHKLLYKPKMTTDGIMDFVKKDILEIQLEFNLLIVDEGSMIPPLIHKDLLALDIPILYIGDLFQLPAILSTEEEKQYGKDFSVLTNPDYSLTEIQRQAKNSPILHAATKVRNGGTLNHFSNSNLPNYKYLKSIPTESQRQSLLLSADVILCGTNNTVKKVNNYVRKLKGLDQTAFPYKDERLVVWRNNHDLGIYNGDVLICLEDYSKHNLMDAINWGNLPVLNCKDEDDESTNVIRPIFKHYLSKQEEDNYKTFLSCYFSIKKNNGKSKKPFFNAIQRKFLDEYNIDYETYPFTSIVEVSFANAITVHKSQGSEYDNVVISNESWCFKDFADRWLYTAITRAKQNLIIVDYLFPYGS